MGKTIHNQTTWDFLRSQRSALVCGGLLLAIGTLLSLTVLWPRETLSAFSISEEAGLLPLLITATTLAGACFITIAWWILSWMVRQLTHFRHFAGATQATATTEFLLALPILMYLFGTVFQMAEIAHAQLVFRYAAFSAARAGSVSNNFLWPPTLRFENGVPVIYNVSRSDELRMRKAAAVALAGLDGHKFKNKRAGFEPLSGSRARRERFRDLPRYYMQAGRYQLAHVRRSSRYPNAWVSEQVFLRQLRDANHALVKFKPLCKNRPALGGDISNTLTSLIANLLRFDQLLGGGGGGAGGMVMDILRGLGIDPQSMLMDVINDIMTSVLRSTGLEEILRAIPGLAPPMMTVKMHYELRLRRASLFHLICPDGKNGYPCITLRRTGKYDLALGEHQDILMQTTGARIDLPVIPPVIFCVNIFPGECRFDETLCPSIF